MIREMQEDELLDALANGVRRTSDLISQATEYHGGAVRTEYLLTTDIAREFIEGGFEVRVECLNRSLVNALTRTNGTTPSKLLRSKRTDVAVVESSVIPLAIVEVKIGVSKITRLKGDLEKVATTLALMKPEFASRAIGALVFQMHTTSKKWYQAEQFRAAAEAKERRLREELRIFGEGRADAFFTMHSLQRPGQGITGRAVDGIGDEAEWGAFGHATRYHAILIRDTRPVLAPPSTIEELRRQSGQ